MRNLRRYVGVEDGYDDYDVADWREFNVEAVGDKFFAGMAWVSGLNCTYIYDFATYYKNKWG